MEVIRKGIFLKKPEWKNYYPFYENIDILTCETPLSCLNTFITVSWAFVHLSQYCANATVMTTLKDFNGGKEFD